LGQIEIGKTSPTYEILLRIVNKFNINANCFFNDQVCNLILSPILSPNSNINGKIEINLNTELQEPAYWYGMCNRVSVLYQKYSENAGPLTTMNLEVAQYLAFISELPDSWRYKSGDRFIDRTTYEDFAKQRDHYSLHLRVVFDMLFDKLSIILLQKTSL
jgi:transcriptional regulator with XRE-family HTH domain